MKELFAPEGSAGAFNDFSPSMQPEFLPEMAGCGGTAMWEDFDEHNG